MRYLLLIVSALGLAACQNISPIPEQPVRLEKAIQTKEASVKTHEKPVPIEKPAPAPEAAQGQADLWPRFQSGLQLEYTNQARVQENIQFYLKNRRILEDSQQRIRYYLFFIMDELEKQGIPLDVALIPLIESQYNPFASSGQPAGLWQFMPATGRRFNLYSSNWYDGRRDPVESTKAVAAYFRYLMNYFNNDFLLALAAYNSGEGTVQNAINRNRRAGKPTDYWHLDLPGVTRTYIPKMVALAEIFKHPDRYQLTLQPIDDKPYFTPIKIDNGITLTQVASALNIPGDELYYLNAGIKRNMQPNRPKYSINIPVDKKENANSLLASVPKAVFVQEQKHLIRSGESLSTIARKYGISVQQIREWNYLKSNTIVAGRTLIIATPKNTAQSSASRKNVQKIGNNGQSIRHRVKSGESLWKIAQTYKVKVSALAQWNKKSVDSPLKIGETLIILTSTKR